MKKYFASFLLFALNISVASTCGPKLIEEFITYVKPIVYHAENGDFAAFSRPDTTYPSIADFNNCLMAYKVSAAGPHCIKVFNFAQNVKSGLTIYHASDAKLSFNLPDEIISYFSTYNGLPSKGGFFPGVDATSLGHVLAPSGGISMYLEAMIQITKNCNLGANIPTYQSAELADLNSKGIAFIDVYHSGIKTCSFIIPTEVDQIRLRIPSTFKSCVQNSDLMITTIERFEEVASKVIANTKKVADSSTNYISNQANSPAKVVASNKKVDSVNAMLTGISAGIADPQTLLKLASIYLEGGIKYEQTQSLDQDMLKIIALCHEVVDPSDVDNGLIHKFLPKWNSEAEKYKSYTTPPANTLLSMYFNLLQNSLFYPYLKTIKEEFISGQVTPIQLNYWERSKSYSICYASYPKEILPEEVTKYLLSNGTLTENPVKLDELK